MTATAIFSLCQTERAILHTLLYFEIFSYPLTAQEVFEFANCPAASADEVSEKLDGLVAQGVAFRVGRFYLAQPEPAWVSRREDCNRRADAALPVARRMARLIGGFPFVRGVCVSGSLSKHCMSTDSDIDFFIITEPRRLWLARTLLVLFKKTVLLNSHKYFCVNYFVDTEHLQIEEQNQFTATETATLLPMYGHEWYERFHAANADWVRAFCPNFPKRATADTPPHTRSMLKKAAEWLLGGWLGERLDLWAMRATVGFWRRKFPHFDEGEFNVALKSRRHVSKHHPMYFQKKVLRLLAEKKARLGEF